MTVMAPPTTARMGRPRGYVPRHRHPGWTAVSMRSAYRETIVSQFVTMTPRERLLARAMYREVRKVDNLFMARAAVFGVCVALISVRP